MTRDEPDYAAILAEFRDARDAMEPLQARMDAGEHGAEFIILYCDAASRLIDAAEAMGGAASSGRPGRRDGATSLPGPFPGIPGDRRWDDAAVKVGCNGRSEGGRFAPGNKLARGNPNNAKMQALRASLLEVAEPRHVQGVYRVLLRAALEGDVQAAKLVLEYTAGKPAAALDVTLGGEDGPGANVVFATILATLAPYPEARFKVAAQLRALAAPPGDD